MQKSIRFQCRLLAVFSLIFGCAGVMLNLSTMVSPLPAELTTIPWWFTVGVLFGSTFFWLAGWNVRIAVTRD